MKEVKFLDLKPRKNIKPIRIKDSKDIVKAGVNLAVGMAALGIVIGAFGSD